jgi:hypothetical protein
MSAEEDLRRLVDEPADGSDYKSADIATLLEAHNGNINKAAQQIWAEKAAQYAQLVNMREGDTQRDLGKLYDNALRMATYFGGLGESPETGSRGTGVSRIIRP